MKFGNFWDIAAVHCGEKGNTLYFRPHTSKVAIARSELGAIP